MAYKSLHDLAPTFFLLSALFRFASCTMLSSNLLLNDVNEMEKNGCQQQDKLS